VLNIVDQPYASGELRAGDFVRAFGLARRPVVLAMTEHPLAVEMGPSINIRLKRHPRGTPFRTEGAWSRLDAVKAVRGNTPKG